MRDNKISVERKKYLKKVTRNKIIIFVYLLHKFYY